jgi:putative ABC transport system ATP-binding protein
VGIIFAGPSHLLGDKLAVSSQAQSSGLAEAHSNGEQAPLNWIASLDGVRKTYGTGASALTAIRVSRLRLPAGRVIALTGASGSGKSTLLNLLGAVDRPTEGRIEVSGVPLTDLSEEQLALFRRRRLGFVFQSFHLLPSLTAYDNVAVPWLLDRKLDSARRDEIHVLLKRLGIADKAKRYPDELSGGQQQRVAMARAVIHHPQLLLADEPTGNLDAHSGEAILDLLFELQRDMGMTIVMATHSQAAAARCNDFLSVKDGYIVDRGGSSEIDLAAERAAASVASETSAMLEPLA